MARPAAPRRAGQEPTQGTWFATQTGQALTRAIAAAHPGDRLNVQRQRPRRLRLLAAVTGL